MAVPTIGASLTIPPASSINAAAQARTVAAAGARSLIPVVYGIDRLPALILNVLAGATAGRLLVQCLWCHACHQVDELRLNDRALHASATVASYTGAQSAPDASLVAAFAAQGVTYTDTLAGYAYSVIDMPTAAFDGQLGFSARIHGRRVYDPRLDTTAGGSGPHRLNDPTTWAWSDNPALVLADWSASTLFGAGAAVDWPTVPTTANACDAIIGSPPEKRRVVGVTLGGGATVPQVADALRTYAGCWLVPGPNGLRLIPDQDGPATATYSHSAGNIAALEPLALRDSGNVPTAVEVVYTDTSQIPWRDAQAMATLPGAGTSKPWRLTQVRLPGVHRYSQARREAIERLNKLSLSDMTTTVDVFDEGAQHDPGDIVSLTHPAGITSKPMRVVGCEMVSIARWRLALAEHDPAAYSSIVETAPTISDTGRVIGEPAGMTWEAIAGRPALFRVVARGYSDTQAPGGVLSGLYYGETGALIQAGARSFAVVAINPATQAVILSAIYDVHAQIGAATTMAAALNALPTGAIVVVFTSDEPKANRLEGGLPAAMYRCGASRAIFGSSDFKSRAAYSLVGVVGSNESNGCESYSGSADNDTNAWCDVAFQIVSGRLIVTGGTYAPRTLIDYGYVGALDATRNKNFAQPTPPSPAESAIGDTWEDTDNGNLKHDWDGAAWVPRPVGVGALDPAARPKTTYKQASDPSVEPGFDARNGTEWIDTDDGDIVRTWFGGAWSSPAAPTPGPAPVQAPGAFWAYRMSLAPVNSAVYFRIQANGAITTQEGSDPVQTVGSWYAPNTAAIGSQYEARMVLQSSAGLSGGVLNDATGWTAITSTLTLSLQTNEDNFATRSRTYIYQVRRVSDGVQVSSGTAVLTAEVEQ